MTRLKTSDINGTRRAERSENRAVQHSEAAPLAAAGEKTADFAAFLSQARDVSRFFSGFTAPKDFQPDPAPPLLPLSPEMARDLGASSLKDFFALALESEERSSIMARSGELPRYFPRGPESIRPTLAALDLEIRRVSRELEHLERTWSSRQPGFESRLRPLENNLAALSESRANLVRAARLWTRMKEEASVWPREAKYLWQRAQRLQEVVSRLLKAAREIEDQGGRSPRESGRRSLTRATVELKAEVGQAKSVLTDEAHWLDGLESLTAELDDVLAVVVEGSQPGRDLNADSRRLSGRLSDLEREDRRLKDESLRAGESLKGALAALSETENRLAGRQGAEMLERLESAGLGIQALWQSTIDRRREMARVYFVLPGRLGRPVFLEKIFLATAQALGRTQALLEDLRHRLSLAGGRLSTTHRLRGEGRNLLERLDRLPPRTAGLRTARKRLGVLAWVVDQRLSLKEAKGALEEALVRGREADRELTRGRAENSRMNRELAASALEKERLAEQLAKTRRGLGDAGLVKARLIKVFERKNELLDEVRQSRLALSDENERLKAERVELRRKRSQLADLYNRERSDLKKLSADLKASQGELARSQEFAAQRRDLETRLDATRQERETLDLRRREVEAQLEERAQSLAAAEARAAALEAELNRHREELAEASRARLNLGEKTAALRRRLDLLSQAHGSLVKTLERRQSYQARSEAELEKAGERLTRQKRNLLHLVSARQELRAELGSVRLKLSDLEKERESLLTRLEEARTQALESDQEKIELRSRLEDLGSQKAALAERLTAFENEKAELSGRLAELEEEKAGLAARVDELAEANRRLPALEEEKTGLEVRIAELTEANLRLTALEEEKADLAARVEELTEANLRLPALEEEKDGLEARIAELTEANLRLPALEEEKADLAARVDELAEASLRLPALEEERAGLEARIAELAEANLRLPALEEERAGLETRIGQLTEENGQYAERLDALKAESGRLAELEMEKTCLQTRLAGLEDEKNRAGFRLTELDQQNERLAAQLADLETRVSDDLTPFIQILGQALWNSESQLSQARAASGELADKVRLEADVQLANLRLQAASREIEYTEQARRESDDLKEVLRTRDADLNQVNEALVTLQRTNDALESQRGALERGNQTLSETVSHLDGRTRKLRRALGTMKGRYDQRLEEGQLTEEGLRGLVERQGRAMEDQKARLAQLEPLVAHFFEAASGESLALPTAGAARPDPALVGYLKEESRTLQGELEGQDLSGPREAAAGSDQPAGLETELQERLEQLQPLVGFLARSFVTGVAELAQARQERSDLADELSQARRDQSTLAGELDQARQDQSALSGELDQAHRERLALTEELEEARREGVSLSEELGQSQFDRLALHDELAQVKRESEAQSEELAQARQERFSQGGELILARQEAEKAAEELARAEQDSLNLSDELARTRQERSALVSELALAVSTREVLENSLLSREMELSEVRDQAFALSQERDQLQDSLERRETEVGNLKTELAQADRDLMENDGRLEAAWAAMNYLGTRAGDTLGSMKKKLEDQVRQVDGLSLELNRREERIKDLEERQDKLALLYWTLVARAMETRAPLAAVPALAVGKDLSAPEAGAAQLAAAPLRPAEPSAADETRDNAANSGGHSLGRGLLEGVKKVARRSLFTLLMAGGLVMAGSFPALASGPGPEWGQAPPKGDLIGAVRPGTGLYSHQPSAAGRPQLSGFSSVAGEAPAHILFRLDSTYIGRSVSLEAVAPEARLAGQPAVESRLAEMVSELAETQGLTNGEFLSLVRTARGPESAVHLSDFSGQAGGLALLETHMPKIARLLRNWPDSSLGSDRLTALMKNAADFKAAEGGFWERLFFDFLAVDSQEGALTSLLSRLEEKKGRAGQVRPEFAGRLAPFPQLENLGPDRFIEFMTEHIKGNWSCPSGRGRYQAARRLAGDIYFSARLFRLPVTLLAALIQEESEADEVDFFRRGATRALYDRAADLLDLTRDYTLSWQEGRPPLCDLDEALAASEKDDFMEAVYRKKMALVMAFNKSLNAGQSLLTDLDD